MPRLRTVFPTTKGLSRRRAGSGFVFLDKEGERITDSEEIERIRSLAIPPAWEDVWISPYPNGHIQAVGTDDAGRRQYLYHQDWRIKRDQMKFDRVLAAARKLPAARRAITRDLGLEGMPLERADAIAVRLLDLGYFRVGNDVYADANGSFGLTTLEKRHVRKQGTSWSSASRASQASSTPSRSTTPRCSTRWTAFAAVAAAPSGCSPTRKLDAGATWTPPR